MKAVPIWRGERAAYVNLCILKDMVGREDMWMFGNNSTDSLPFLECFASTHPRPHNSLRFSFTGEPLLGSVHMAGVGINPSSRCGSCEVG